MFLKFVTTLVIALVLVVAVTQVIVPLWRGQRLFPAFGRRARLERELERWRLDEEERRMEQEIARRAAGAFDLPPLPPASDTAPPEPESPPRPPTPPRKELE
jgi:hypothetical protein